MNQLSNSAPSEYIHQSKYFLVQWLLFSIDHHCVAKQCFLIYLQNWYFPHSHANFKSVRSQCSLLRCQIKVICWERSFISKFITFQAYILKLLKIDHNTPDCPYDSNQKVYIYIKQESAFHDHCKIHFNILWEGFYFYFTLYCCWIFFQTITNIEQ